MLQQGQPLTPQGFGLSQSAVAGQIVPQVYQALRDA